MSCCNIDLPMLHARLYLEQVGFEERPGVDAFLRAGMPRIVSLIHCCSPMWIQNSIKAVYLIPHCSSP